MNTTISSELRELLERVFLCVEATSFERLYLWELNSISPAPNRHVGSLSWTSVTGGWLATVGQVGNMPVCLSLTFATINGHLVLFHEATSLVVDHRQVKMWLRDNVPAFREGRKCDASGFTPGLLM